MRALADGEGVQPGRRLFVDRCHEVAVPTTSVDEALEILRRDVGLLEYCGAPSPILRRIGKGFRTGDDQAAEHACECDRGDSRRPRRRRDVPAARQSRHEPHDREQSRTHADRRSSPGKHLANGRWIAPALACLEFLAGCVSTLEREASRAAHEGIDTEPIIAALAGQFAEIEATKRVFDVTLIEGRRRFSGEGAIEYRADPRRVRADVYGPHSTPVVHVALDGEALTVTLPQEGRVLTGELGDPSFAALTGEQALVSPEVLGALLGAYDVRQMIEGAQTVAAAAEGDRRTLYIRHPDAIHALTLGAASGLVEYRQARAGRLVYRVRFEQFQPVDGRESPRHVVLRDFVQDRQLVVDVTLEREDLSGEF
jgi:hypothetical protein